MHYNDLIVDRIEYEVLLYTVSSQCVIIINRNFATLKWGRGLASPRIIYPQKPRATGA